LNLPIQNLYLTALEFGVDMRVFVGVLPVFVAVLMIFTGYPALSAEPNSLGEVLLRVKSPESAALQRSVVRLVFQQVDASTNRIAAFNQDPANAFLVSIDPTRANEAADGWFTVRAKVKPGRYVLSFAVVRWGSNGAMVTTTSDMHKQTLAYDIDATGPSYLGDYALPLIRVDGTAESALKFVGYGDVTALGASHQVAAQSATFECVPDSSGLFSRRSPCSDFWEAMRGLGGMPVPNVQ
jgi:hypothetical protein